MMRSAAVGGWMDILGSLGGYCAAIAGKVLYCTRRFCSALCIVLIYAYRYAAPCAGREVSEFPGIRTGPAISLVRLRSPESSVQRKCWTSIRIWIVQTLQSSCHEDNLWPRRC